MGIISEIFDDRQGFEPVNVQRGLAGVICPAYTMIEQAARLVGDKDLRRAVGIRSSELPLAKKFCGLEVNYEDSGIQLVAKDERPFAMCAQVARLLVQQIEIVNTGPDSTQLEIRVPMDKRSQAKRLRQQAEQLDQVADIEEAVDRWKTAAAEDLGVSKKDVSEVLAIRHAVRLMVRLREVAVGRMDEFQTAVNPGENCPQRPAKAINR